MPWERKTVMEQREEFVERAISGQQTMAALCREYGISRKTGYKWLNRIINTKPASVRSDRSGFLTHPTSLMSMTGMVSTLGAVSGSAALRKKTK